MVPAAGSESESGQPPKRQKAGPPADSADQLQESGGSLDNGSASMRQALAAHRLGADVDAALLQKPRSMLGLCFSDIGSK